MHRSAGHVTSKTEGTCLVRDKPQRCGLTWVCLHRKTVPIDVKTMDNIIAYQLDGDLITSIHLKLGRGVSKLPRIDLKSSLLRRDRPNWQWRKRHRQPSHH